MFRLIRVGIWLSIFTALLFPLITNLWDLFGFDDVFYQFEVKTVQMLDTIGSSIQGVRGVINACLVESLGTVGVPIFNVLLHLALLLPVFGMSIRFFVGMYRVLV